MVLYIYFHTELTLKSKNTEDIIELIKTLRITQQSKAESKLKTYDKLLENINKGIDLYDDINNLLL